MAKVDKTEYMPPIPVKKIPMPTEDDEWAYRTEPEAESHLLDIESDAQMRKKYFAQADTGHPARANLHMIIWLIEKLTEMEDTILDPMSGAGTSMFATMLGRHVMNIELEKHLAEIQMYNWAHLQAFNPTGDFQVFNDDCRMRILSLPRQPQHVIFSPPYCLAPDTLILKSDLTWVPLSTVKVGDELIGVDETHKGTSQGFTRKMQRSLVEATKKIVVPAYTITLSNGKKVTCSGNHKWLWIPTHNTYARATHSHWLETTQLEPGTILKCLGEPWETGTDYEHGYLAGVYDGEGWIGGWKETGDAPHTGDVGFKQNEGIVLDTVTNLLWDLEFNPAIESKVLRLSRCTECMRFMGSIRPKRLMQKAYLTWEGHPIRGHSDSWQVEVEDVEEIGDMELIDLQTSTKTFFANGLVSHNSHMLGRPGPKLAALAIESNTSVMDYGKNKAQVGHLSYFLYMEAMGAIYKQLYQVLPKGGYMCTITKDFVDSKRGEAYGANGLIPLSAGTVKVCYEAGFEMHEVWQRDAPPSLLLRMSWKQNPGIPHVNTEEILIFRRP